jgi:hypothetical protein
MRVGQLCVDTLLDPGKSHSLHLAGWSGLILTKMKGMASVLLLECSLSVEEHFFPFEKLISHGKLDKSGSRHRL